MRAVVRRGRLSGAREPAVPIRSLLQENLSMHPISRALSLVLGLTSAVGTFAGCGGGAAPGALGSELNGTWQTPCFDNRGFNFARTTLAYDDLALTGTYEEFEDAACTRATHVSHWTGVGVVSGTTTGGDSKLDLSFMTFTSTALTAANADFNNMNAYCGITDWAAGAERDVLGASCYGFSIPVGGESLDIYRVDGDTLRFGDGSMIGLDLQESARPTMLSATQVFTRQ